MEVNLAPEKVALLQQFASRTGRDASELVIEAVDRLLECNVRFVEAVEEGRATARRGEFLKHDDVVARIETIFRTADNNSRPGLAQGALSRKQTADH